MEVRQRIAFKTYKTKKLIYGNKKNLKGLKIYISEQLTLLRSELYHYARKPVTDTHAQVARTIDGKIFVKHKDKDPKHVTSTKEIGEYLGM